MKGTKRSTHLAKTQPTDEGMEEVTIFPLLRGRADEAKPSSQPHSLLK